jgi:hypothetical protein
MTKQAVNEVVNPNQVTRVVIILDKSGSMGACQGVTVSGFNEQVQTIKSKAEGGKYFLSLVQFNHDVDPTIWNAEPKDVAELTVEQYAPTGGTAMLDAVGETLLRLEEVGDTEDTAYLVIIISDGLENASKRFDYVTVGEMIQQRQATGRWTFTYMGANQDLSVITQQLHIPVGNTALYESDESGTEYAMTVASRNLAGYMTCRSRGKSAMKGFYAAADGDAPADLTKLKEVENDPEGD